MKRPVATCFRRRNHTVPWSSLVFCTIAVASAARLEAAIVTYQFSGTLNSAVGNVVGGTGPTTPLPGDIGADGHGQAYTGTFSFDDQAPLFESFPGEFAYTWPVGTVTIDIGGYLFSYIRYGGITGEQFASLDSPSAPNEQAFGLNGQDRDLNAPENFSDVSLGLLGQTGFLSSTTLSGIQLDPSLLLSGPGNSAVELIETFAGNPAASFQIDATITQLSPLTPSPAVPEPATLIIFGQVMLLVGVRRWRHPRKGG